MYMEIVQKMIRQCWEDLVPPQHYFSIFYVVLLLAGIHFCKLRSEQSIFFSFLKVKSGVM